MKFQEVLLLNVYSIQVKFQLIIIWIFRMRLLFHYFTAYINSWERGGISDLKNPSPYYFLPLYLLALYFLVIFSIQKLGALVKCKFGTLDLALRHGPVQTEAK